MVGVMGSPGGTSDPVLEIFQMLKDVGVYQMRYDALVKAEADANAANAHAVDQQARAAEVTTKANADLDVLLKKSEAFNRTIDARNAAAAARETAVAEKSKACDARAARLAEQEIALVKETSRARSELNTARDKFAAEMTSKTNAHETRVAALAARERASTDNINRQIAELDQRNAAVKQLFAQAGDVKAEYERKLTAFKALVS